MNHIALLVVIHPMSIREGYDFVKRPDNCTSWRRWRIRLTNTDVFVDKTRHRDGEEKQAATINHAQSDPHSCVLVFELVLSVITNISAKVGSRGNDAISENLGRGGKCNLVTQQNT